MGKRWLQFRWSLSVAAWWLWLKVTPEHPFKRDMVDAVAALGRRWRTGLKAQEGKLGEDR